MPYIKLTQARKLIYLRIKHQLYFFLKVSAHCQLMISGKQRKPIKIGYTSLLSELATRALRAYTCAEVKLVGGLTQSACSDEDFHS